MRQEKHSRVALTKPFLFGSFQFAFPLFLLVQLQNRLQCFLHFQWVENVENVPISSSIRFCPLHRLHEHLGCGTEMVIKVYIIRRRR